MTVSQPSAALTARAEAQGASDGLFLGLGAVALLIGAVGVANNMIISVLERRSEIGLRRVVGATNADFRSGKSAPFCWAGLVTGLRYYRGLPPRVYSWRGLNSGQMRPGKDCYLRDT
jgi:hypothetical protein